MIAHDAPTPLVPWPICLTQLLTMIQHSFHFHFPLWRMWGRESTNRWCGWCRCIDFKRNLQRLLPNSAPDLIWGWASSYWVLCRSTRITCMGSIKNSHNQGNWPCKAELDNQTMYMVCKIARGHAIHVSGVLGELDLAGNIDTAGGTSPMSFTEVNEKDINKLWNCLLV